jgi:hypothetical protein
MDEIGGPTNSFPKFLQKLFNVERNRHGMDIGSSVKGCGRYSGYGRWVLCGHWGGLEEEQRPVQEECDYGVYLTDI